MNCMKCGSEAREGEIFCDACLAGMAKEPVKINATVKIPTQPPRKNTYRRPVVNPEEEIKRLQYINQNLILALILTGVAAALFAVLLYGRSVWEVVDELGRNYSVIETTLPG